MTDKLFAQQVGHARDSELWSSSSTHELSALPPQGAAAASSLRRSWQSALRNHWPEYLMEGAELGLFMISACVFVVLLEHPASSIHQAIANGTLRRILIGLAMGLTAIAIIYSPLGKRSGAHFNPSVTFTFYRLGRVEWWDAVFYSLAQFVPTGGEGSREGLSCHNVCSRHGEIALVLPIPTVDARFSTGERDQMLDSAHGFGASLVGAGGGQVLSKAARSGHARRANEAVPRLASAANEPAFEHPRAARRMRAAPAATPGPRHPRNDWKATLNDSGAPACCALYR